MNYPIINGMVLRSYILLMLFQIIISCRSPQDSENRRIVHEWIGKEIIFPDLISRSQINKSTNNNLKIVTRINGNCYPCLSQLNHWKKLIEEISSEYQISFYIFIVADDYEIFNSINEKEIHFDYPFIYDRNDEFYRINKLPQKSAFHTMLLTEKNKVILIGNPIGNIALKDLYVKEIIKHQTGK
jgi:hypothetical protein